MSKQQGGYEEGGTHTPVGTRRTFFGWVTKVAAGLIGIGLAIPLAGYVISPALKRRERSWVDVGGAEWASGWAMSMGWHLLIQKNGAGQ